MLMRSRGAEVNVGGRLLVSTLGSESAKSFRILPIPEGAISAADLAYLDPIDRPGDPRMAEGYFGM